MRFRKTIKKRRNNVIAFIIAFLLLLGITESQEKCQRCPPTCRPPSEAKWYLYSYQIQPPEEINGQAVALAVILVGCSCLKDSDVAFVSEDIRIALLREINPVLEAIWYSELTTAKQKIVNNIISKVQNWTKDSATKVQILGFMDKAIYFLDRPKEMFKREQIIEITGFNSDDIDLIVKAARFMMYTAALDCGGSGAWFHDCCCKSGGAAGQFWDHIVRAREHPSMPPSDNVPWP